MNALAEQERAADSEQALVAEEHSEPQVLDAQGRVRRVRALDFSQPTKFTAELRRRIVRTLGPFCEAVAGRLCTELRAPVELRVGDSSQLTWSAAKATLGAPSISVALSVRPIDRQMLLDIELPIVLQALECLLGGSAAQAPAERRLSEIDWALARGLLDSIVMQLTLAWRDLGGLELVPGEVDLDGDGGVLAPTGEPTFALTLDCRIDGLRSSMSLLIPWSAIEPVASELLREESPQGPADPYEGHAVQSGLAGAEVLLRGEIGSVLMPVQRMLALRPGTLLALQDRAEDGVLLFAEGVPLGRGRPGLRGARRAIKLTGAREDHAVSHAAARAAHGSGGDRAGAPDGLREDGGTSVARMLGVTVRVWAELGRARMGLGRALELPPGAVVELDQGAEEPIDLYAGGLRFATGSLQVSPEGEWAVLIEALV